MRKLGPVGLKWLKIFHLALVALFFGGIMSSAALSAWLKLGAFSEVSVAYRIMLVVSDYVVRTGAQGTLIIGFIYGFWTNWGFFRHRWITVKWVVFMAQTLIGILIVDKLMVANATMLEVRKSMALTDPAFAQNHALRQYVVLIQIALTLFLIAVSVLKPWKKKDIRP